MSWLFYSTNKPVFGIANFTCVSASNQRTIFHVYFKMTPIWSHLRLKSQEPVSSNLFVIGNRAAKNQLKHTKKWTVYDHMFVGHYQGNRVSWNEDTAFSQLPSYTNDTANKKIYFKNIINLFMEVIT